ncbi:hypothetical protein OAE21_01735 [Rubripirellula sp.]|nr:hypothetical protein [Rubripirellula sp.]MDB4624772.1 hypothetical protein [Rubripirellula sp.]
MAVRVRDAISVMAVESSTLTRGSTIQRTDVIPATAAETTAGNPVASADLSSVVFRVCGAIDPLLLDVMDAEPRDVAAVATKFSQDAIPVTVAALDVRGQRPTLIRWKSPKLVAKSCVLLNPRQLGK